MGSTDLLVAHLRLGDGRSHGRRGPRYVSLRRSTAMSGTPPQYGRMGDLGPRPLPQVRRSRLRPAVDLLARVPPIEAAEVLDLGCGPGNVTRLLAERWPEARVVGIDSSPEMLDKARADLPDLEWIEADIEQWVPSGPVDVVASNATLHWLDDQLRCSGLKRSPGCALAVSWRSRCPTASAARRTPPPSTWSGTRPGGTSSDVLLNPVADPRQYVEWLAPPRPTSTCGPRRTCTCSRAPIRWWSGPRARSSVRSWNLSTRTSGRSSWAATGTRWRLPTHRFLDGPDAVPLPGACSSSPLRLESSGQ